MFYSTGYIAVALQDEDSPRTQGNYIYINIRLMYVISYNDVDSPRTFGLWAQLI